MANQRRLADNLNHYDANRHGVPRQGNALLQGIAICGRCGRRMGLHYSGQNGNYPVYLCRADQHQHGGPRCQEVRALGVDAAAERLLLEALTPDRLALAIAALGELENEARALERQWSLKRERARYEAERARRQYDAVEPENRLVARSLERVWEDKLRQAEQIDIEYESWRRQQPISLAAADRAQITSPVGDEVNVIPSFSLNDYSTYGEVILVPDHAVVRQPKALSFTEAASVWMMFVTAYGALIEDAKVAKGDFVLIPAASSSVGLAAIQIANYAGARTIALTRTSAKKQQLLDAGAAHVIATEETDLVGEVMRITNGLGARVAFDPVGGPTFPKLISALSSGGILYIYGLLSTGVTPLPVLEMIAKVQTIKAHTSG